jgi:hypothetical protein
VIPALTFFLSLAAVSIGSAQTTGTFAFDPKLSSSVQQDGLHLQIELDSTMWGLSHTWTVTPAGLDLYRSDLGSYACSWVRITDTPLPWSWVDEDDPHAVFEYVDTTAQPGRGYVYMARSVDAQRQPIAENDDAPLGPATHGEALIAHGALYAGPGGCGLSYVQQVYDLCPLECSIVEPLRGYYVSNVAADVVQYFNTGIPLLLYGEITGAQDFVCQQNEYWANLTAAVPSLCVVSVQETHWSNVKRLYR